MRPTIKTIAEALGVSAATVSMALRGHPRISLPTRQRVEQKARELGYRPNPSVAELMAQIREGRPHAGESVLAFLNTSDRLNYFDSGQPFYREVFEGYRSRSEELGYRLDSFWLGEPNMTSRRLASILANRGIRGVLVPPVVPARRELDFPFERFSSVTYGYSLQSPRLNRVVANQRQSMMLCLLEAARRGYKRVGFVLHSNFEGRVGFIMSRIYEWFQLQFPPNQRLGILKLESGSMNSTCLEAWLDETRADAVISHFPEMRELIEGTGRRVPDDVGLVLATNAEPDLGISGIDVGKGSIARECVNLLVGQLSRNEIGLPDPAKTVLVDVAWTEGATLPVIRETEEPDFAKKAFW